MLAAATSADKGSSAKYRTPRTIGSPAYKAGHMKLITGMRRSGPSLVARLFYEAGADLGAPGTFYRPDRWNPDGYFEQREIQGVNMKLIHGMLWKLAYFRLPSTETIRRRAERARAELRRLAQKYAGKVV